MRKCLCILMLLVAGVAVAADYTYPSGSYSGPYPLQTAATTGNGKSVDLRYSAAASIRIDWGTATAGTIQCQEKVGALWSVIGPALLVDTVTHATVVDFQKPSGEVRCVISSAADQAVSVTLYATPLR